MKIINEKTAPVVKFVAGTAAAMLMTHVITNHICTCIEFVCDVAKMTCDKIESL